MGGVVFVFIGGVVGAGFATGQELWLFFGRYGSVGILGILLSGLMLGAFGAEILGWATKERTAEHGSLFSRLLGKRMGLGADLMLSCFLFVVVAVMEAAGGEVGKQFFRLPVNWGIFVLILLASLSLWQKNGIIRASSLLVPLLITLMLLISLASFTLPSQRAALPLDPPLPWWLAAFFYASYNLLLVFSALCALAPNLLSLREGKLSSWLASGILTCLNLVLFAALSRQGGAGQLPILSLARRLGPLFGWAYLLALFFAIFTSLLAATWGMGRRLSGKLPEPVVEVLILILAWPLSRFGFAKIVASCYPLFGSFGFLLLLLLWSGSVKRNRVALLWIK